MKLLMYHANSYRRYVTLKMYINNTVLGSHVDNELEMYQRIAQGPKAILVAKLYDLFSIPSMSMDQRINIAVSCIPL